MTIFGHIYGNWAPSVPKNLVICNGEFNGSAILEKRYQLKSNFQIGFNLVPTCRMLPHAECCFPAGAVIVN